MHRWRRYFKRYRCLHRVLVPSVPSTISPLALFLPIRSIFLPSAPLNPTNVTSFCRNTFRSSLRSAVQTQNIPPSLVSLLSSPSFLTSTQWNCEEQVLLVQTLLCLKQKSNALTFLTKPDQTPIETINELFAMNSKHGKTDIALGLYEIMQELHLEPTIPTINNFLNTFLQSSKPSMHHGIHLYQRMQKDYPALYNHRTISTCIVLHARTRQWKEVNQLLLRIRSEENIEFVYKVYSLAMHQCQLLHDYSASSQLFSKFLMFYGEIPENMHLLNTALAACARAKDIQGLNTLFQLLDAHDIYTYNTLIAAFGNAGLYEKAFTVFEKMKKQDRVPDVVTFNALLTVCLRNRNLHSVQKKIESCMKKQNVNWNTSTLTILLSICAREKDVKGAERIWDQAQMKRHIHLTRRCYEGLMQVYAEAEEHTKVLDLYKNSEAFRKFARSAKTLNFLLSSCLSKLDVARAIDLQREFEEYGHVVSSIANNYTAKIYLAANQFENALKLMDQIGNSVHSKVYILTQLIKHLSQENEHGRALYLFRWHIKQILGAQSKDAHLQYPLDALYIFAARSALATKAHVQLVQIFKSSQTSVKARQELARIVIASCDACEDWKTAVSVYDHVLNDLDNSNHVALYEQVVKIVARAGTFEQALDVNGGEWYRVTRR